MENKTVDLPNGFKPMLADPPDTSKYPLKYPLYVSPKIDGFRVCVIGGKGYTRSLKEIPNPYIREYISKFNNLDGEIVCGNPTDPDVFNRTSSLVRREYGEPEFTFWAFDYLGCDRKTPFADRALLIAGEVLHHSDERLRLVPQTIVYDDAYLDELYVRYLEKGYEGAIAKPSSAPYKYGRASAKSQEQLKLKPWEESEAVILDVIEAEENLNKAYINEKGLMQRSSHQDNKIGKGMVGKFLVRDIYSGVEFMLSPGLLTHDERIRLWGTRFGLIDGKTVCTYKFVPIGVKDKPRMNGFIRFRPMIDIDMSKVKFL